ncbi:MAG: hypothetical protein AAGD07_23495, partial [Planctomycetota bacterium]
VFSWPEQVAFAISSCPRFRPVIAVRPQTETKIMPPDRNRVFPLLLTIILLMLPVRSTHAQSDTVPVKVTDAKLHSIDYGIESLMHWVQKARPGDASRASSLMRDHGKLVVRFNRIPRNDGEQYKYVESRLSKTLRAINALTGDAKKPPANASSSSGTSVKQAARSHPDLVNIASQLESLQLDITRYRDSHKQRTRMRSDLETIQKRLNRLPKSENQDYLRI